MNAIYRWPVIAILFVGGCGLLGPDTTGYEQRVLAFDLQRAGFEAFGRALALAELNASRAKWETANIASYEYESRAFCALCPTDPNQPRHVIIRVENGVVTDVRNAEDGTPVTAEFLDFIQYVTINGLFEQIEDALERNDPGAIVTAKYNLEDGTPTMLVESFHPDIEDGGGHSTFGPVVPQ